MASVYGYITVANLESYSRVDYETLNATYDDTFVEVIITMAERWVNVQLKGTTPTATDGVILATTLLSERWMHEVMVVDGHRQPKPDTAEAFINKIIDTCLGEDNYSPVKSIAMQGVNRY